MKNTITVTIPFSFKGVNREPSSVIDLDVFLEQNDNFDFVYYQVATENKIDNYSYEYEVLESSAKIFSHPTGVAEEFLRNNVFDLLGFKQRKDDTATLDKIQAIAQESLHIENINDESHAELKQALLKAYQAGTES